MSEVFPRLPNVTPRIWQPMGFRCECESGWGGARCDVPLAASSTGECAARPCLNGGTCRDAPDGPACDCRPGFAGALCDQSADCRAAGCPPHQECTEGGGVWVCAAASAESACSSSPCHNGTCLALDSGLFRCQCPAGFNGWCLTLYLLFVFITAVNATNVTTTELRTRY